MECFAGSCGEQLRVVELALIGDHVCVGARSRDQIIVPDQLSNPRPRHAREVQQRHAAPASTATPLLPT